MKDNVLVISDVHLGSPVSKVKTVANVLKKEKYSHLIINGDLFGLYKSRADDVNNDWKSKGITYQI